MQTIEVKSNQSLLDIALQEYGDVSGLFFLLEDNPDLVGFTDNIFQGDTLIIRDTKINSQMVQYLKEFDVATVLGARGEGIGYMKIETDFIVDGVSTPIGYVFTDSDAQNYYNALSTINGGDIDSSTLYGISLDVLKEGINDFFVNLKSNNVFSKVSRMFLFIGGTDLTHSINALNGSSELTYFGSPTHSASGVSLNGLTQYIDLNNDPSADVSVSSGHLSVFFNSLNDQASVGSRDSPYTALWIRKSTQLELIYNYSSKIFHTASSSDYSKVLIASRTLLNQMDFYIDGINVGSTTISNNGTPPVSNSTIIGGVRIPSIQSYTLGDVKFNSLGDGLSSSEAIALNNEVKTLNNLLNR